MTFNRRDMLKYLAVTLASCGQEIVVPGTCEPKRKHNDLEGKCEGTRRSLNFDSSRVDNDGDGSSFARDCNDYDPEVRPGLFDGFDGKDNNCNGVIDDFGGGKVIFTHSEYEGILGGVYTYDFRTDEVELLEENNHLGFGFDVSPDRSKFVITGSDNNLNIFDISGRFLYDLIVPNIPGVFTGDRVLNGSWVEDETFAVEQKLLEDSFGNLNNGKIYLIRDGIKTQLTPNIDGDEESIKDVSDGKIIGIGNYHDTPHRRYAMFMYDIGNDEPREFLNLPVNQLGTYRFARSDNNFILFQSNNDSGQGLFRYDLRTDAEPELILPYAARGNDGSFQGTYMHPQGERVFIFNADGTNSTTLSCFLDGSGFSESPIWRRLPDGNFKEYLALDYIGILEPLE
jgi:hypothetical protein